MKLCSSCKNGAYGSPSRCPECGADLTAEPERAGSELGGMVVADRYELREVLGQGGTGWVYRAVHLGLERPVAVKLMTPSGSDDRWIRRFEREARAASRLHHPHVVSVIDFGRASNGLAYLITEFVQGSDLFDLLKSNPRLPLARALGIFQQVLAAIEEAHNVGVVHRDIKPENIIVTQLRSGEDWVKVVDFGIATMADEENLRVTVAGTFAGTPGYVAPEHISGEQATERSDIYALGSILYDLLAGRPAFAGKGHMDVISQQLNSDPIPLREAAPGREYPESLEKVISRAMDRDPSRRWPGVEHLREALLAAVAEIGPVRLGCESCSRGRDPLTGHCDLHRGAAPITAPTEAPIAAHPTSAQPVTVTDVPDDELVHRILDDGVYERQAEAERLVRFFRSADPLLEIIGNSGIGKTTLLAGAARAAERLRLRVIGAAPDPSGTRSPWYPIRVLVGQLLGCGPEPDSEAALAAALEQRLGPLPGVSTGLALLFGFSPDAAPARHDERRMRVQRAALAALEAAADRHAGLCILLDDAEDYDRPSWAFCFALAHQDTRLPTKLIIASETGLLPHAGDHSELRPRHLGVEGVASILADERPDDAEGTVLVRNLARATIGNPLFARHAIRALGEGLEAEETLEDLLASRLAHRSNGQRRLLQALSVFGTSAATELVDEVLGEDLMDAPRRALVAAGLLADTGEARLEAAHPRVTQAALESLSDLARSELHRRAFDALERRGASTFLLAHHADAARLDSQALHLLEQAGDEACRWLDDEGAALDYYRRVVHVARWKVQLGAEDERFLELSLKAASALSNAGHRRAAEESFRELLVTGQRHPRVVEAARQGLAALERAG